MAPESSGHDHDAGGTGRRVRRGEGPRAARQRALARERRRVRLRRGAIVLVVLGALGLLLPRYGGQLLSSAGDLLASVFQDDAPDPASSAEPGDGSPSPSPSGEQDQRLTVLMATIDEQGGDTATAIQLLTFDRTTGRGAVVFVPTTMVADVPGFGLLPLGDAAAFGGVPLLELTLENQLSIAVDAAVGITEQGWAAFFSRIGGFDVDVREALSERTSDGSLNRRFEPGEQFLDGPRLAELLTFRLDDEDELSSFTRAQSVLEGLLRVAAEDGALDPVFEDGAPMLGQTDVAVVEPTIRALAEASTRDAVVLRTLPVTSVGSGQEVFYRLDDERSTDFVRDVLGGGEVADATPGGATRLEVLNGNGQAGIGADVAALLVPLGHTVVITRNADDFDHPVTRVLLHGDDDELLEAAQGIVEALGVGRIEVSSVRSTIVDITIVVGADFRG